MYLVRINLENTENSGKAVRYFIILGVGVSVRLTSMYTKITIVFVQSFYGGNIRSSFDYFIDPFDCSYHFVPAKVNTILFLHTVLVSIKGKPKLVVREKRLIPPFKLVEYQMLYHLGFMLWMTCSFSMYPIKVNTAHNQLQK